MNPVGHPVFQRELLEQARRPASHLLRSAAVLLLLAGAALISDPVQLRSASSGREHFVGFNRLLFLLVWGLGPLLTADCLSGEKRSATLGLLFLTPLRPVEVVLAKASAHLLRGVTLLAASAPLLVVPLVLGGVTGPDVVRMLLYHFAALILALSAGLLASSWCRSEASARATALAVALVSAVLLLTFHITAGALATWWGNPASRSGAGFSEAWIQRFRFLWWSTGIPHGTLRLLPGTLSTPQPGWTEVATAAGVLGAAALTAAAVVGAAARRLARTWRPAEASTRIPDASAPASAPSPGIPTEGAAAWWVRHACAAWLHPGAWLLAGIVAGAVFRGGVPRGAFPIRDLLLISTAAGMTAVTRHRCLPEGFTELVGTTPTSLSPFVRDWLDRTTLVSGLAGVGGLAGTHLALGLPAATGEVPVGVALAGWLLLPVALSTVPRLVHAARILRVPEPFALALPGLLLLGFPRFAGLFAGLRGLATTVVPAVLWLGVFAATSGFLRRTRDPGRCA